MVVEPEGMGQYRCNYLLEPGMILKAINGVPADRLAYTACVHIPISPYFHSPIAQ